MICPACEQEAMDSNGSCKSCGLFAPFAESFVNELSYYRWESNVYKTKLNRLYDEMKTHSGSNAFNKSRQAEPGTGKTEQKNQKANKTSKKNYSERELSELNSLADRFHENDDYYSELNVLLEIEEQAQNDSIFLAKLGRAYRCCGKIDKAKECYERSIAQNPDYSTSYANLGVIYFVTKDYSTAVPLFEKALLLIEENKPMYSNADYYTTLANYGASLAGLGRKKEGEKYIKKAEALGYSKGDALRKMVGL